MHDKGETLLRCVQSTHPTGRSAWGAFFRFNTPQILWAIALPEPPRFVTNSQRFGQKPHREHQVPPPLPFAVGREVERGVKHMLYVGGRRGSLRKPPLRLHVIFPSTIGQNWPMFSLLAITFIWRLIEIKEQRLKRALGFPVSNRR